MKTKRIISEKYDEEDDDEEDDEKEEDEEDDLPRLLLLIPEFFTLPFVWNISFHSSSSCFMFFVEFL